MIEEIAMLLAAPIEFQTNIKQLTLKLPNPK
jgi:hypothetical protein